MYIAEVIRSVFNTKDTNIELIPLKQGMTNDSFIFSINNERYIIRVPGANTEKIINRHQEYDVYQAIKDEEFVEPVIYIDRDKGYKISKFIENSHTVNPKDWNDGKATERGKEQATSYKGLIIAGPTEKGKELAAKINSGQELTWDDLNSAKWGVLGTSSSSGYIYPTLWLQDKYGKGISDLQNVVQSDSYASSAARLASGQIDIMVGYADVRNDYAKKWTSDYGRSEDIFKETNVIGVTPDIYNDTISVSKSSPIVDDAFKEAFANAMIKLAETDEGKEVIKIYSHSGYKKANASDYDKEREAQKVLKKLKSGN